jgi:hypothetical protein
MNLLVICLMFDLEGSADSARRSVFHKRKPQGLRSELRALSSNSFHRKLLNSKFALRECRLVCSNYVQKRRINLLGMKIRRASSRGNALLVRAIQGTIILRESTSLHISGRLPVEEHHTANLDLGYYVQPRIQWPRSHKRSKVSVRASTALLVVHERGSYGHGQAADRV